jgi:hypothetical protein
MTSVNEPLRYSGVPLTSLVDRLRESHPMDQLLTRALRGSDGVA